MLTICKIYINLVRGGEMLVLKWHGITQDLLYFNVTIFRTKSITSETKCSTFALSTAATLELLSSCLVRSLKQETKHQQT